jgi:hypothetical protein
VYSTKEGTRNAYKIFLGNLQIKILLGRPIRGKRIILKVVVKIGGKDVARGHTTVPK